MSKITNWIMGSSAAVLALGLMIGANPIADACNTKQAGTNTSEVSTHQFSMGHKNTKRDIIETAVGPGMQTVTTLVTAIQAAELIDALKQPGPFTVFAPTNDAFNKLPEGTVAELLKPENKEKLQAILLYHVHAGEAIMADELKNGQIKTLNGKPLNVKIDGPTVTVNNATVTKTDVVASNGVIHWIDTVIIP